MYFAFTSGDFDTNSVRVHFQLRVLQQTPSPARRQATHRAKRRQCRYGLERRNGGRRGRAGVELEEESVGAVKFPLIGCKQNRPAGISRAVLLNYAYLQSNLLLRYFIKAIFI
ncbi:hypothetical protein [Hymenobacter edaphi]|uniref:hypothetical protein n=1 Tax=Hymenobacter edaphi TaxID=2211146 RepID=UPI00105803AF|nr:hypothetical protein [Hymenobacter edaphi]